MRSTLPAAVTLAALCSAPLAAPAASVTIGASHDATLIDFPAAGDVANGSGSYFFAGANQSSEPRRALISFDVGAAVPVGSRITSVTMRLHMSRTRGGAWPMALHACLSPWGEGPSDALNNEGSGAPPEPGDSTWNYRFYPDVLWTTPGGDFSPTVSGTATISGVGFYTWSSTPGMVSDAQAWLDAPARNYGWVMQGEEGNFQTTKRFDSRSIGNTSFRPAMTIGFTPPCRADFDRSGEVDANDVSAFLNAWYADVIGGTVAADYDRSGETDANDISAYINEWYAALTNGGAC